MKGPIEFVFWVTRDDGESEAIFSFATSQVTDVSMAPKRDKEHTVFHINITVKEG